MSSDLYAEYHASRQDERRGLFEIARKELGVESGLYPGCFVHIMPSFDIRRMVYVDTDRRAQSFFSTGVGEALVREYKAYREEPDIAFHLQDYMKQLPIDDGSVDLLVSQYAGFVSEHCKRYLRKGGVLIANNSHADAGLASCDPDLELIAVIERRGERFRLSSSRLDEYFIPKSVRVPQGNDALRQHLRRLGKGIAYTRPAANYVFQKL